MTRKCHRTDFRVSKSILAGLFYKTPFSNEQRKMNNEASKNDKWAYGNTNSLLQVAQKCRSQISAAGGGRDVRFSATC